VACGSVLGQFPFTISVTSTQEVWQPVSRPIMIVGSKALDYALTIRQLTGGAVAIPATALMTARPEVIGSLAAASGSYANAQATTHHVTDTSGITNSFLAQPGLLAKLSGAGNASYISGVLSVIHRACATPIGSRAIEVDPRLTNAAPQTYPLGRVPASGGDKLRAAIVANAMNKIEYLFYVRGINDPDAPGAWVALNTSTWTTIADGSSAICHADASVSSVTPANYHLLEFAIALRLIAAQSGPAGFLRVAAGMSYT
jgi:hypothetical protein